MALPAPPLAVVHPGYAVALPRPRRPRRRPRRPEPAPAVVPVALVDEPPVSAALPALATAAVEHAIRPGEDEEDDEMALLLSLWSVTRDD